MTFNLDLSNANAWVGDGRRPKLNTMHPFYSPSMVSAIVASGAGILDLITGAYATNTGVMFGLDDMGPYVNSNDTTGGAQCSMTLSATGVEFISVGVIFKHIATTSRGFTYTFSGSNSGIFVNGNTAQWFIGNGGVQTAAFNVVAGHTYIMLLTNSVGTAGQLRSYYCMDLMTGAIQSGSNASADIVALTPITVFTPSGAFLNNDRVYAAFTSGDVLIPPSVTPQARAFLSPAAMIAGLADPWGLWYA